MASSPRPGRAAARTVVRTGAGAGGAALGALAAGGRGLSAWGVRFPRLPGVRRRPLDEEERAVAARVFGAGLDLDRVVLTDVRGRGGRPFTAPGPDGRTYLNLGPLYDDPLAADPPRYPRRGQTLVHELVHAWQVQHTRSLPGLMRRWLATQADDLLGRDVYDPGPDPGPWDDLNPEQQATVVDRWYAGDAGQPPESEASPWFPYVRDRLRAG